MLRQTRLLNSGLHELADSIGLQAHGYDAKYGGQPPVVGQKVQPSRCDPNAADAFRFAEGFGQLCLHQSVLMQIGRIRREVWNFLFKLHHVPVMKTFWIAICKKSEQTLLSLSIDFHGSPNVGFSHFQHTGNRATCAVVGLAGCRPEFTDEVCHA